MANRHTYPNHEMFISLNLSVIVKQLSDYSPITKERELEIIEDMSNQLQSWVEGKITGETWHIVDLTQTCDSVALEISVNNK